MRKVRRTRLKKLLIVLAMVAGMVTVGVSYAIWNSSLNIDTNITTGNLDILFRDSVNEKYQASLVDVNGREKAKVNAEFTMQEKGKKLKMSFKTGLPLTNLMEGYLIKIDFPLTPSLENTVTTLAEREIDFSKEGELVEMKCDKAMVLSDMELYSTSVLEEGFTQDLKFDLYYTVSFENEGEKNEMMGTVFLKLRDESVQSLQNLPHMLAFKQSDLQKLTTLTEEERAEFQQDGIVVSYTCEFPFYLEQKDGEKFSTEK